MPCITGQVPGGGGIQIVNITGQNQAYVDEPIELGITAEGSGIGLTTETFNIKVDGKTEGIIEFKIEGDNQLARTATVSIAQTGQYTISVGQESKTVEVIERMDDPPVEDPDPPKDDEPEQPKKDGNKNLYIVGAGLAAIAALSRRKK